MSHIVAYRVLEEISPEGLAAKVMEYVMAGWELQGSVSAYWQSNAECTWYVQAVVMVGR